MKKMATHAPLVGPGITINTDASFHPHHRTAGYAFWIICDHFKIQKGGMFKKKMPNNSFEAEIMCMGNAIATLLAQKHIPAVHWVAINSDCMNGMECISGGTRPLGVEVLNLWNRLQKKTGAQVMAFRHVRAHTGKRDSRSFVNEWCDKEAKKWQQRATKEKLHTK